MTDPNLGKQAVETTLAEWRAAWHFAEPDPVILPEDDAPIPVATTEPTPTTGTGRAGLHMIGLALFGWFVAANSDLSWWQSALAVVVGYPIVLAVLSREVSKTPEQRDEERVRERTRRPKVRRTLWIAANVLGLGTPALVRSLPGIVLFTSVEIID